MGTQKIIVYRSESEQLLDQFLVSGYLIPFLFGIVAFFVLFFALVKGEEKVRGRFHNNYTSLWLTISGVVGCLVTYLTW